MSLKQKAIKGVIWSAIQSVGGQVLSFTVFLLLARLIEPQAFGLIASASVFLAFIQIFLEQGFSEAIIQKPEVDEKHLNTAFWVNCLIGSLLTVASLIGAQPVATFFKEPALSPIISWLSISFVFSALSSVQNAVLSRKFAFKLLALRSLIATVIGGIAGVTAAFLGLGVWSLVVQQLVNGFIAVVALWLASEWRPRFEFSAEHAKELFTFGINVTGFNFVNFFNRRSDDLLIGYYLGAVALGYYSVAYRILLIMTQVLISTSTKVVLPTFSRLQQEPERLRRTFYKVTQFSSIVTFPIFLAVSVLAPEIVQVAFGEKWLPSIPIMQVLALIGPIHVILFYNSSVMMAMGKPDWRLWIQILNTVCNVIGFILVVRWGVVAVAAFYVIRGYLLFPISVWAIYKLININMAHYLQQYAVPFLCSMAMVLAMFAVKAFLGSDLSIFFTLPIEIVCGALIYVGLILWVSPDLYLELQNVSYIKGILTGNKKP